MSVTKDPIKKTWTVQVWYKDFAGKRKHTTKRGFATKKEAEKYERNFLSAEHPAKLTVGQLVKEYLKDWEVKLSTGIVRQTTYVSKKRVIKRFIVAYFENTDAYSLSTANVNEWINNLTKTSSLTNPKSERLCSGTIKMAKQALSQIFEYGKQNFGLTSNPVDGANNIPHYSNDKRSMWTIEQFIQFHNALAGNHMQIVYDIIFASGLRIGEVLALTPNDIAPYYLNVSKTVVYTVGRGTEINPPKTKSSARKVEIPRGLYYDIVRYMENIPNLKPTDRLFPWCAHSLRVLLMLTEEKLKLPHTSLHILRHLYASTVYNECKDLTVVSKQLGHKNIDITSKIYTHFIEGNDRAVVDNLESVLTIKEQKKQN